MVSGEQVFSWALRCEIRYGNLLTTSCIFFCCRISPTPLIVWRAVVLCSCHLSVATLRIFCSGDNLYLSRIHNGTQNARKTRSHARVYKHTFTRTHSRARTTYVLKWIHSLNAQMYSMILASFHLNQPRCGDVLSDPSFPDEDADPDSYDCQLFLLLAPLSPLCLVLFWVQMVQHGLGRHAAAGRHWVLVALLRRVRDPSRILFRLICCCSSVCNVVHCCWPWVVTDDMGCIICHMPNHSNSTKSYFILKATPYDSNI